MTTTAPAPNPPRLAVAGTARALLGAVEAWYADETHGAAPLPARRYVAAGEPRTVAWDCDEGQVTVALAAVPLNVRPDMTAPLATQAPGRNRSTQLIRTAQYELQIVRPAPTSTLGGQAPARDVLDAAGLALMDDVAQLLACLNSAQTGGALVPAGHAPAPVMVPTVEVLGPEGPLAGLAAGVWVTLL